MSSRCVDSVHGLDSRLVSLGHVSFIEIHSSTRAKEGNAPYTVAEDGAKRRGTFCAPTQSGNRPK